MGGRPFHPSPCQGAAVHRSGRQAAAYPAVSGPGNLAQPSVRTVCFALGMVESGPLTGRGGTPRTWLGRLGTWSLAAVATAAGLVVLVAAVLIVVGNPSNEASGDIGVGLLAALALAAMSLLTVAALGFAVGSAVLASGRVRVLGIFGGAAAILGWGLTVVRVALIWAGWG